MNQYLLKNKLEQCHNITARFGADTFQFLEKCVTVNILRVACIVGAIVPGTFPIPCNIKGVKNIKKFTVQPFRCPVQ